MTTDLLSRIEADRTAARAALEQERAVLRQRFPYVAALVATFRDAAAAEPAPPRLLPRPVYAVNDQGETWGAPPRLEGFPVDGDKLARLPEFEESWRRFYAKQPDNKTSYNERAQRAIRPHMHRGTE